MLFVYFHVFLVLEEEEESKKEEEMSFIEKVDLFKAKY